MASHDWVHTPQGSSFGSVNSCVSDDGRKGFIAAVFGTAAHKVIQDFNEALNPEPAAPNTPLFDAAGIAVTAHEPRELNYAELLASFEREALHGYEITQEIIPIPKGCETFTDAMNSVGADYMQYIIGHLALEKVREPKLVVNASEQQFVMFVTFPAPNAPNGANDAAANNPADMYVFYGTIDQICSIPEEGKLIVRDFKFRDAAFKPSWRQLQVDPQLIIYACAMKHGIPCCDDCKPRYAEDAEFALVSKRKIVYDGPCDACKASIGTHKWPKEYPDAGELTWMKDFRILKRGTAYRKKGEVAGQANYEFRFNSVNVNAYMYDIMQHCRAFRYGSFPRKYGEACKFWCKHARDCVDSLILESND